jgi:3-hydroxyacyl-[acyl-carrier-protein] dehydratase
MARPNIRVVDKHPYVEMAEISLDHPALAGHFPGNPIVPGAVVLAYVEQAVWKAFGRRVSSVMVAKFQAPLRPSRQFEIEVVTRQPDTVDFRVTTAGTLIASGKLRLVSGSS